jgi:predicted metalloendopeptidase
VIGHEIGHGFDDQGSAFDANGVQRDWWTADTKAKFLTKTAALNAQYDKYCPLPDACISGALTTGENIGDLGGLIMAYTAYKQSLGGKEAPVLDGLTGDQRFFLAWAQVWRAMSREDNMRNMLATDPHSPPEFRVNGVVPNIDEWYTAFNIQPTDKMYIPPEKRVRIW